MITATGPETWCHGDRSGHTVPWKRSQNQRLLWAWNRQGNHVSDMLLRSLLSDHCPWCMGYKYCPLDASRFCVPLHNRPNPSSLVSSRLFGPTYLLSRSFSEIWFASCLLHFGADWRVWILEGSLISRFQGCHPADLQVPITELTQFLSRHSERVWVTVYRQMDLWTMLETACTVQWLLWRSCKILKSLVLP